MRRREPPQVAPNMQHAKTRGNQPLSTHIPPTRSRHTLASNPTIPKALSGFYTVNLIFTI